MPSSSVNPPTAAPDQVDFSTLLLGFASAALSYLGVGADGESAKNQNLPLARQNIDIIELLKEKTKSNLTTEESTLLDQILADLRTRYVQSARQKSAT